MQQSWSIYKYRILLLVIAVAGMTQGLLNPLLSTMLEEQGVPSIINGLSAAALYIGIIVIAPFCAPILQRLGYQRSIFWGLVVTTCAIFLIPLMPGLWSWSVLRFFVGIGDSLLHYGTQLWITIAAPETERGKRISLYGLMYGVGYGIGPQGIHLLRFGEMTPFLALVGVMVIAILLVYKLDLQAQTEKHQEKLLSVPIVRIYRLGLVALCPALIYGLLETVMAVNFPIYGLREGISKEWVSILITAFVYGSLILQVPLGTLSDRLGRKKILVVACTIGSMGMLMVPLVGNHVYLLFMILAVTGGFVGSLFTLGLSYLTDLLPPHYLPKANAIASVHFSVGSMIGPYMGGFFIQYLGGGSLFHFIAVVLGGFVCLALAYQPPRKEEKQISTAI
ncbi:MFS transporter [Thermoflavimicrobium dichotomicum]|uniref:Predicted arabinose efflux permease, MFS family n=1 Tax=Thermoflavimicrobium dichotomicum TaxID=46223 RepID=A0A1I3LKZ1_9BACL|nr:MFS transporter [Thermoflavimicrobium dichotomicum]SFI85402.1 Predicted arabinose efflux permease, MFS family [Thermoflavimicrobium dichotomicum]